MNFSCLFYYLIGKWDVYRWCSGFWSIKCLLNVYRFLPVLVLLLFPSPRSISFLFYVSLQYDKELTDSISLVLELCLSFPNSCPQQLHRKSSHPSVNPKLCSLCFRCRQFFVLIYVSTQSLSSHWHPTKLNPRTGNTKLRTQLTAHFPQKYWPTPTREVAIPTGLLPFPPAADDISSSNR